VLGVPLSTPVPAASATPGGRPVADQVYGVVPPAAVNVTPTATPVGLLIAPGLVTTTPVVQVNDALPVSVAASFAVTFAANVPAVDGVPLTTPVPALMLNPPGRPVAVHEYGVAPPVAATANVNATPVGLDIAPGFVTTGAPAALAGAADRNVAITASTAATATTHIRGGYNRCDDDEGRDCRTVRLAIKTEPSPQRNYSSQKVKFGQESAVTPAAGHHQPPDRQRQPKQVDQLPHHPTPHRQNRRTRQPLPHRLHRTAARAGRNTTTVDQAPLQLSGTANAR
jgi:hypothetical protein